MAEPRTENYAKVPSQSNKISKAVDTLNASLDASDNAEE
jgi:hypothetical protein